MKKFVLIARSTDIRRISLDVNTKVDVVLQLGSMKQTHGIDYDVLTERVYWCDIGSKSVNSAFLNGTGKTCFIFGNLSGIMINAVSKGSSPNIASDIKRI